MFGFDSYNDKCDFAPEQMDVLLRVFDRACSSYITDNPVFDDERATRRVQLASAIFDTAKRHLDEGTNDDSVVENLKNLSLKLFMSQTRFGTH